jgi:DNA-binding NtrC family response regulator
MHDKAQVEGDGPGTAVILDDDPDVRASLADALQSAGFEVAAFSVGGDALAWLDQHAHATKLVIVDLMMAGMSGDAFLTEKERRARTAEVPVIIMTGSGRDVCDEVARRHAVFRCLEKPMMLDSLLATARDCSRGKLPS